MGLRRVKGWYLHEIGNLKAKWTTCRMISVTRFELVSSNNNVLLEYKSKSVTVQIINMYMLQTHLCKWLIMDVTICRHTYTTCGHTYISTVQEIHWSIDDTDRMWWWTNHFFLSHVVSSLTPLATHSGTILDSLLAMADTDTLKAEANY